MQRFYHFLGDNRAYVTLAMTVLVSLVMLGLGPSAKLRMARGVATSMLKTGHWLFAWPMNIARLKSENQLLREQNLRLSLEVLDLREARLENIRLRNMLHFRAEKTGAYVAARVIARDPDRVPNTILIDAGHGQGVESQMPVLTPDGLVGRVLEAHAGTSVVQLLLDRNCPVSAIVQRRGRAEGIVMCENGTFYLKYVPLRSDIRMGDAVISSGLGEVFPKGLMIGRVAKLGKEEQGLFREVVLEPSANFASLEEVFVLKWKWTHGRVNPDMH